MGRRDYKGELEEFLALSGMRPQWTLETEYRFHPTRRWRFDWAWIEPKIAVEYDGIMYSDASHSSMSGILRDSEKINEAQLLGWRVFRTNAKTVGDGSFFDLIERLMEQEGYG